MYAITVTHISGDHLGNELNLHPNTIYYMTMNSWCQMCKRKHAQVLVRPVKK